jgi:hypothetical protein
MSTSKPSYLEQCAGYVLLLTVNALFLGQALGRSFLNVVTCLLKPLEFDFGRSGPALPFVLHVVIRTMTFLGHDLTPYSDYFR